MRWAGSNGLRVAGPGECCIAAPVRARGERGVGAKADGDRPTAEAMGGKDAWQCLQLSSMGVLPALPVDSYSSEIANRFVCTVVPRICVRPAAL